MTKPLSPAAEKVLDAVFDHWPGGYNHPGKPLCVAAAIRAAAHHLQRCSPWSNDDFESIPVDWCTSELHDIATELEVTNGPA